jgi:hypothetical protein
MRAMPACGEKPARSGYQFGQQSESLLTGDEHAQLETLEAFALVGDWSEVNEQFFAMSTELRARREASGDGLQKAGLTNYLYCSDLDCACRTTADCAATGGGTCERGFCVKDGTTRCNGLAFRLVTQCRDYRAVNNDQCEALGRVHAARRCLTLPCINSKEDGRLDRILQDSSGSPNPFEPWPD